MAFDYTNLAKRIVALRDEADDKDNIYRFFKRGNHSPYKKLLELIDELNEIKQELSGGREMKRFGELQTEARMVIAGLRKYVRLNPPIVKDVLPRIEAKLNNLVEAISGIQSAKSSISSAGTPLSSQKSKKS